VVSGSCQQLFHFFAGRGLSVGEDLPSCLQRTVVSPFSRQPTLLLFAKKIVKARSQPFPSRPAFPYDEDLPSIFLQTSQILSVANYIPFALGDPECSMGFWNYSAIPAPVQMPETPVDENDLTPSWDYYVGPPRELRVVQGVFVSQ
jgi:hypothetical protein